MPKLQMVMADELYLFVNNSQSFVFLIAIAYFQDCIILSTHCKIPAKDGGIYSQLLAWHSMVGTIDFIQLQDRFDI